MAEQALPIFRLRTTARDEVVYRDSLLREEWRIKLLKVITDAHDDGRAYATIEVPDYKRSVTALGSCGTTGTPGKIVISLLHDYGYHVHSYNEETHQVNITWDKPYSGCMCDYGTELPMAATLRMVFSEDAARKYGPSLQAKLDAAPKTQPKLLIADEGIFVNDRSGCESGMLRTYMFLLNQSGYKARYVAASFRECLPGHILVSFDE